MFAFALLLAADVMVVPLVHKDANESARFAEALRAEIDARPSHSSNSLANVIDTLLPKKSERYERAQKQLGLADSALEKGDIDDALLRYEDAVKLLAEAEDFTNDKRILLEKTRLALASRLLGLNEKAKAKKHLRDAWSSNPELILSELEYPPKVRALFKVSREEAQKSARHSITITSNKPGARVFIEGRKVGLTPYKVERAPAARYRVWLERAGFRGKTRWVSIADADVSLNINHGLEASLRLESKTIDLQTPTSEAHEGLFELFKSDTIALVAQDETSAFGVLIRQGQPTQKVIVSRGENAAKLWAMCAFDQEKCQTLPFPKGFYEGLSAPTKVNASGSSSESEEGSQLLPIALYSGAALVTVLAIAGATSYALFVYEPERGEFGVEVVR